MSQDADYLEKDYCLELAMNKYIWDNGVFGLKTAESLQYTMHFYNCKLLALRAYDEHTDLMSNQFEIGKDTLGKYIHFVGKSTQIFKGGLAEKELTTKDIKHYCNEGRIYLFILKNR